MSGFVFAKDIDVWDRKLSRKGQHQIQALSSKPALGSSDSTLLGPWMFPTVGALDNKHQVFQHEWLAQKTLD